MNFFFSYNFLHYKVYRFDVIEVQLLSLNIIERYWVVIERLHIVYLIYQNTFDVISVDMSKL